MIISNDQLAQLILNNKLVDKDGLEEILQFAKNANLNLDQAILEKNVIPDETLGLVIANYVKVPFVKLSKLAIPEEVFHIVPEKVARKQKVIAYERSPPRNKARNGQPLQPRAYRACGSENWTTSTALSGNGKGYI